MAAKLDPFVQRVLDTFNRGKLDDFDALLTDDVVLFRAGEKAHGREEWKAVVARLRRAFPDLQYRIDDAIVAGDRMVLRWEARGTHSGEYLGIQGTGSPVSYTGITLYELRDGKIARAFVAADLLSLWRQLRETRPGATPEART
jgi:steroid delta-isomerase-like uncharacterized protein